MKVGLWDLKFFLVFLSLLNSAHAIGDFLNVFKGAGSIQTAISTKDTAALADIMKWNKCHLLVANDNSLLKQLYINLHPDLVSDILLTYCKTSEFFDEAIQIALLRDDDFILESLLLTIGEILDYGNYWLHENIFEACVHANNYKCIEIMSDWQIYLNSKQTNILHFAAMKDNPILLRYAPIDERLMNKKDSIGNYPCQFVSSKEMATALNDRWETEVQIKAPGWSEVELHYQMTRIFEIPDKTLKYRVARATRIWNQNLSKKPFRLDINRSTALKDTYAAVSKNPTTWYKSDLKLNVNFINEFGIDAGGPRIDWLNILIDSIFNNKNAKGSVEDFTAPLFKIIDEESMMYAPTNLYDKSVYEFVGSIIALALRDKISLRVALIPAISKQFAGKKWAYSDEDFAQQHPEIYKGLMNLHNLNAEELEMSGLQFESDPSKLVTAANLSEYIKDIGTQKLILDYQPAVKALVTGFKAISEKANISNLFNANEMRTILKGGEENLSHDAFLRNCLFEMPNSIPAEELERTKTIFVEMVLSMNMEELFKLFTFITGRESIPFDGLDSLEKKMTVKPGFIAENGYPAASTCFSHLKLPRNIKSAEELKEKIMFSINYSKKFTTE